MYRNLEWLVFHVNIYIFKSLPKVFFKLAPVVTLPHAASAGIATAIKSSLSLSHLLTRSTATYTVQKDETHSLCHLRGNTFFNLDPPADGCKISNYHVAWSGICLFVIESNLVLLAVTSCCPIWTKTTISIYLLRGNKAMPKLIKYPWNGLQQAQFFFFFFTKKININGTAVGGLSSLFWKSTPPAIMARIWWKNGHFCPYNEVW